MEVDLPIMIYIWAGYTGVGLYLMSYALLQFGVIRGVGYTYTLMNMAAASLVLVSMMHQFSMSAAMIQISWISISLYGLARSWVLSKRARFTEEEAELLAHHFPHMPRPMARSFLSMGNWTTAAPGTTLTREAEPVPALFCVTDGLAKVEVSGIEVGHVSSGFVGEMNVLGEGPASATVSVEAPSRLFSIPGSTLRARCRRDAEFRSFLDWSLIRDTRRKLVASNHRNSRKAS